MHCLHYQCPPFSLTWTHSLGWYCGCTWQQVCPTSLLDSSTPCRIRNRSACWSFMTCLGLFSSFWTRDCSFGHCGAQCFELYSHLKDPSNHSIHWRWSINGDRFTRYQIWAEDWTSAGSMLFFSGFLGFYWEGNSIAGAVPNFWLIECGSLLPLWLLADKIDWTQCKTFHQTYFFAAQSTGWLKQGTCHTTAANFFWFTEFYLRIAT